jgi:hypothetical protein
VRGRAKSVAWDIAYKPVSADAESDWLARSANFELDPTGAATGPQEVIFATDFRSANDFNSASLSSGGRGKFGSDQGAGQAANEALVTQGSNKIAGTNGKCLHIDLPADGSGNQAAWIASFDRRWTQKSQGILGRRLYIQTRHYFPSSRLTLQPGTENGGPYSAGFKYLDLACYDPTDPRNGSKSNTLFEIICQNIQWRNIFQAYHRDSTAQFPPFVTFINGGLDAYLQTERPACLYSDSPGFSGCIHLPTDTWFTLYTELYVQTLGGTTGNNFKQSVSWLGQAKTPLFNVTGFDLGPDQDGFTNGHSGFWFNGYETNRTGGGTTTYQETTQAIAAWQPIADPVY